MGRSHSLSKSWSSRNSETDSASSSNSSTPSARAYLRWGSFDQKRNLGECPLPNPGLRHKVTRAPITEVGPEESDGPPPPAETKDPFPGHSTYSIPYSKKSSLSGELKSEPEPVGHSVVESPTILVSPVEPSTPASPAWCPPKAMTSRAARSNLRDQDDPVVYVGEAQTRVGSRIMRTVSMDTFRTSQSRDSSQNLPSWRPSERGSSFTELSSCDDYSTVDLGQDSEGKEVPVLELPDFRKKCPTPQGTSQNGVVYSSEPFSKRNIKVKEFQLLVPSIGGCPPKSDFVQGDRHLPSLDGNSQPPTQLARTQSGGANALLYGCGITSKSVSKSHSNAINRKVSSSSLSSSFSYSFAPSSGTSSHCSSSYSSHTSSPGNQWHSPGSARNKGQSILSLMDLPDECLVKIISKFHSVKDWLSCTRVCKRWAVLANDGLSTLRLNNNVNYSGRGGVFTLLHRFPNLTFLEVPTSVCSNSFCANLKTSCPRLHTLTLAACGPAPVPRTPGSKLEPQALPPAIGTLTTLRELRVQSDLVAGFPGSLGLLSNLEVLELDVCRRVKSLPESLGELKALKVLSLVEVRGLLSIPESIGLLWDLHSLKVSLCSNLTSLPSSIGKLSALEYLEISNCENITELPASFCKLTSLQTIKLLGFKVLQRLAGPKLGEISEEYGSHRRNFPHLRRLELGWSEGSSHLPVYQTPGVTSVSTNSQSLAGLLDWFGPLSCLKVLEFRQCRDLAHLPLSILEIRSLEQFCLINCPALQSLPNNLNNWSNLRHLEISKCVQLADIPSSIGQLHALNSMVLKDVHRLELLPKSIGNLPALRTLQLLHCPRLVSLPSSFGRLSSLEALEIWRCSSLVLLPQSFCHLSSLHKLRIINCQSLEALPEEFGELKSLSLLEVVDCGRISELPDSVGGLTSLTSLTLRLRGLEALPASFGQLNSLKSLVLAGVGSLLCLPSTFGYLSALKSLEIESGDRLVTLPETFGRLESMEVLKIQWCDSLMLLPESFGQLTSLTSLEVTDCRQLETLPLSMGDLNSLETLRIRECPSLTSLPLSFGDLSSLQSLALRGTPIASLPHSFGHLSALQHLSIHSATLSSLPETFGHLICLYDLRIEHCPNFSSLPRSFGGLISLHSLRLLALPGLSELPPSFAHLSGLRQVEIQDAGVTSLECLGDLKALTKVEIKGCQNLPESWGNMGRWMHRLPSTRLTITFSPPKQERKGKHVGKSNLKVEKGGGDPEKQCSIM